MLPRVAVFLVCLLGEVRGHGYMIDPPARSSLWRVNKDAPRNYNDMSVNCGGFETEYHMDHGKCGVCGDPFHMPQPRDNEAGGKYGRGIISKNYKPGEEITIGVHVTANHKGFFEFRLCKNDDVTKIVEQSCLDQNLLQLKNGSGTSTRFFLPPQKLGLVEVSAILPAGLTCTQCVLQMRWREGNYVGFGPDHTECVGCGPQVEFYGCSDIAIGQGGSGTGKTMTNPPHGPFGHTNPPNPVTKTPVPTMPPTSGIIQWPNPTVVNGNGPFSTCHGTHHESGLEKLDQWCVDECQKGNCPEFLCECPDAFGTQPPATSKPTTKQPYTPPPVTRQPDTPVPVTKRPYTPAPVTQQPIAGTSSSSKGPQRLTGFNEFDGCRGTGLWGIGDIGLDNWCVENCSKGNCPSIMCKCP